MQPNKAEIPQFHTRAMRKALLRSLDGYTQAILRYFYRDLTGDSSASDERIHEIINMEPEDPNTVIDLREVKKNDTRRKG